MTDSLLEVRELTVRYGPIEAVHAVSLTVSAGEIVCLVGSNGAGKSSTLKGVMGLADARGTVVLRGRNVEGLVTSERIRAGIALVPEGRHVFPALTVNENLVLGYRDSDRRYFAERYDSVLAAFPRLAERRDQAAGTMSGGEQQMLAIGRALMSGPSVLLLDEPTLGLAPVIVDRVAEVLQGLRAGGQGILVAEQNLHMALSLADRGVVLETGVVTLSDTAERLKRDERVREAYLGIERQ